MIRYLINHGFPPSWKSGQLSQEYFNVVAKQIDDKYPTEQNLIIDGTWLNVDFQKQCESLLETYSPTQVFIGSLVDPWEMDEWAQNKFLTNSEVKIIMFGNVDTEHNFNFWAVYCDNIFSKFKPNEIKLRPNFKLFLCYQDKPRLHRQMLAHKLINANLHTSGVLTLNRFGNHPFLYSNLTVMSAENSPPPPVNNETNIGNMSIWNSCFLNIVSETEIAPTGHVFLSEKTWKPIMGMRPFVINGDPRIYNYLEKHGFKTFGSYFPVDRLKVSSGIEETTDIIVEIVQQLKQQSQDDLNKLYNDIAEDLQYNRNRFYEFAQEQKYKINNLFI